MPITFTVAKKDVANVKLNEQSLENAIKYFEPYSQNTCGQIVSSSSQKGYVAGFYHGFIGAIFKAYNHHHRLALRPDDAWMALLTQMSLYICNNAEELRYKFVNHDGKQELVVGAEGSLFTANYEDLSRRMIDVMNPFLKDDVRDWILPRFTTTTLNDTTVASVVMMSSMQKYFSYKMELCCGIPEVTLLGEVDDWVNIRTRVDKLLEYDNKTGEMARWHAMLVPIFDEFVNSIKGSPNIEFWNKICHYTETGSGPSYLSGWVTAFTVFDDNQHLSYGLE